MRCLLSVDAHGDIIRSICQVPLPSSGSSQQERLFASVSNDCCVKVWAEEHLDTCVARQCDAHDGFVFRKRAVLALLPLRWSRRSRPRTEVSSPKFLCRRLCERAPYRFAALHFGRRLLCQSLAPRRGVRGVFSGIALPAGAAASQHRLASRSVSLSLEAFKGLGREASKAGVCDGSAAVGESLKRRLGDVLRRRPSSVGNCLSEKTPRVQVSALSRQPGGKVCVSASGATTRREFFQRKPYAATQPRWQR